MQSPFALAMSSSFSGAAIRQAFLDFYAQRGHQVLPSASLVPEDPTVLLTIAGMLPFKPIFLGHQDPPYPRVTTAQKCVRTNDIENGTARATSPPWPSKTLTRA
jgi:alanyl-tRNA synthetase